MFKIAICDDEISFQKILQEKLYQFYGMLEVEIEMFSVGMDLINSYEKW